MTFLLAPHLHRPVNAHEVLSVLAGGRLRESSMFDPGLLLAFTSAVAVLMLITKPNAAVIDVNSVNCSGWADRRAG